MTAEVKKIKIDGQREKEYPTIFDSEELIVCYDNKTITYLYDDVRDMVNKLVELFGAETEVLLCIENEKITCYDTIGYYDDKKGILEEYAEKENWFVAFDGFTPVKEYLEDYYLPVLEDDEEE